MPDVVLPVLDEAAAIPLVLDRMPPGYDPIVVDNGSTDGSAEIAARCGARVVTEPRRGFGAACFAGLVAARADVVCFMDCDGSLDPRDLPAVTAELDHADLVLGARRPSARRVALARPAREPRPGAELARRGGPRLQDLGPMRAARRDALLELGIARPALRLAARDGGPRAACRLGARRGRRAVFAARRRPLEGDRHRARDGADDP